MNTYLFFAIVTLLIHTGEMGPVSNDELEKAYKAFNLCKEKIGFDSKETLNREVLKKYGLCIIKQIGFMTISNENIERAQKVVRGLIEEEQADHIINSCLTQSFFRKTVVQLSTCLGMLKIDPEIVIPILNTLKEKQPVLT